MQSLADGYTCFSGTTASGLYAAGRVDGFSVFDARKDKELCRRSFPEGNGVRCIDLLPGSPIVAFVGDSTYNLERRGGRQRNRGRDGGGTADSTFTPKVVHIYDDSRERVVGKITCPTEVVDVKLRSNCILVRTAEHMHIHSLDTLEEVDSFPLRENALFAASEPASSRISTDKDSGRQSCIFRMVYTDQLPGEIHVRTYKLLYTPPALSDRKYWGAGESMAEGAGTHSMQSTSFSSSYDGPGAPPAPSSSSFIQLEGVSERNQKCHKTGVARLTISMDSSRFASVSDHGTLVRVFDSAKLICVAMCRRGTTPANVLFLHLGKSGKRLLASSDHGTVHVFDLTTAKPDHEVRATSKLSLEQTKVIDLFSDKENDSIGVVFSQMSSKIYNV